MRRVIVVACGVFLLGVGGEWASAAGGGLSRRMATFTLNGYVLSGGEYWPYRGAEPLRYPEDVLWGFYPEKGVVPPGETDANPASATPAAVACATKAWIALRAFLTSNPPELRQIVERGATHGITPRFYLWTNDYSQARDPYVEPRREARLWYWKRKQPAEGKPPGYWKWESTLNQKGECAVPQATQIKAYLADKLVELARP